MILPCPLSQGPIEHKLLSENLVLTISGEMIKRRDHESALNYDDLVSCFPCSIGIASVTGTHRF